MGSRFERMGHAITSEVIKRCKDYEILLTSKHFSQHIAEWMAYHDIPRYLRTKKWKDHPHLEKKIAWKKVFEKRRKVMVDSIRDGETFEFVDSKRVLVAKARDVLYSAIANDRAEVFRCLCLSGRFDLSLLLREAVRSPSCFQVALDLGLCKKATRVTATVMMETAMIAKNIDAIRSIVDMGLNYMRYEVAMYATRIDFAPALKIIDGYDERNAILEAARCSSAKSFAYLNDLVNLDERGLAACLEFTLYERCNDIVVLLLDKYKDMIDTRKYSRRILTTGNIEVIGKMLDIGHQLTAEDLKHAIMSNNFDTVRFLLDKGCPMENCLSKAMESPFIAKLLISRGYKLSPGEKITPKSRWHKMVLELMK